MIKVEQLRGLCRWFAACGVRSVKLSGGEPTILRELPDHISAAAECREKVVVVTNGIRLDDQIISALVAASGEIKVSIHHAGRANDEVLGRESFTDVIENIGRCRKVGIPCSVNSVVGKLNRDELSELTEMAYGLGCRKITFIPFVPRGRGLRNRSVFDLDDAERSDVSAEIDALARRYISEMEVREIDLRSKPYWIVENDLSLVEERWIESEDRVVLSAADMLAIIDAENSLGARSS